MIMHDDNTNKKGSTVLEEDQGKPLQTTPRPPQSHTVVGFLQPVLQGNESSTHSSVELCNTSTPLSVSDIKSAISNIQQSSSQDKGKDEVEPFDGTDWKPVTTWLIDSFAKIPSTAPQVFSYLRAAGKHEVRVYRQNSKSGYATHYFNDKKVSSKKFQAESGKSLQSTISNTNWNKFFNIPKDPEPILRRPHTSQPLVQGTSHSAPQMRKTTGDGNSDKSRENQEET